MSYDFALFEQGRMIGQFEILEISHGDTVYPSYAYNYYPH